MSAGQAMVRMNRMKGVQNIFERLDQQQVGTLKAATMASLLTVTQHVAKKKLLGQLLKRQTGGLIRSVEASPVLVVLPLGVRGLFGSNLHYAKKHELGFSGVEQVRAHVRKGREKEIKVKAHQREVNVKAKHFMRSGLREKLTKVERIYLKAFRLSLERGGIPTSGELLGA